MWLRGTPVWNSCTFQILRFLGSISTTSFLPKEVATGPLSVGGWWSAPDGARCESRRELRRLVLSCRQGAEPPRLERSSGPVRRFPPFSQSLRDRRRIAIAAPAMCPFGRRASLVLPCVGSPRRRPHSGAEPIPAKRPCERGSPLSNETLRLNAASPLARRHSQSLEPAERG